MKPTKRNREDMKTYVYALLMMGLVKSALPSNTIPTTVPTDVPTDVPLPTTIPNSDDGEQSNSNSSVTPTRSGLFLLFLLTANAFL